MQLLLIFFLIMKKLNKITKQKLNINKDNVKINTYTK